MQERQESWHLDKRVPISIIFTILLQLGSFIWFASQMTYQVQNNSESIRKLETSISSVKSDAALQAIQLGRIEEMIKSTNNSMLRVERLLGNGR